MAAGFHPNWPYHRSRNVREKSLDGLADLMADSRPYGPMWPLVASRRAGRTWALESIADKLNADNADNADGQASVLDLHRDQWPPNPAPPAGAYLLLDEPEKQLARAEEFVEECRQLEQDGVKILLAVSPAEWSLVRSRILAEDRPKMRDRQTLPPLHPEEQAALAGRAAWGPGLLATLPDAWRGNPFLLELLLSVAEEDAELRLPAKRRDLEKAAIQAAYSGHDYIGEVFDKGLGEDDQAMLRAVARGEPPTAGDRATVDQCRGLKVVV